MHRLLKTQQIGRLGFIAEHYPLIIPLQMDEGLKLAAANKANVTFEVDEIDQRVRTGWSVVVRGLAEEVGEHHRAELVERPPPVEPWAPGEHGPYVRLIVHDISGRRITPGSLPPPFEAASCL